MTVSLVDETSQHNYPPHISPTYHAAAADDVTNAILLPLLETPDIEHRENDHHPVSPDHANTYNYDYDDTGDNIQPAEPNSIPILITNAETRDINEKGIHPTCLTKIAPTCKPKTCRLSACLLNV